MEGLHGGEMGIVRRLVKSAAILALIVGLVAGPVRSEEGRDLRKASDDDLVRIMRTERPTSALTEALRASRRKSMFEFALQRAVQDATGDGLFNAVEHLMRLGMFSGGIRDALSFLGESEVAMEGTLRKIDHPDLHVYSVEMDVRRVLAGAIRLTPENTPLRVLASVMGPEHTRWIRIHMRPWDEGTLISVFAKKGEALFEKRRMLVRGWTAWGGHIWKSTGREESMLRLLSPLFLRDPRALMEGMQAEDKDEQWLATIRTVMVCHGLGEPFTRWWGGKKRSRLDRDRLDAVRPEVIKALKAVEGSVVWSQERGILKRVKGTKAVK